MPHSDLQARPFLEGDAATIWRCRTPHEASMRSSSGDEGVTASVDLRA